MCACTCAAQITGVSAGSIPADTLSGGATVTFLSKEGAAAGSGAGCAARLASHVMRRLLRNFSEPLPGPDRAQGGTNAAHADHRKHAAAVHHPVAAVPAAAAAAAAQPPCRCEAAPSASACCGWLTLTRPNLTRPAAHSRAAARIQLAVPRASAAARRVAPTKVAEPASELCAQPPRPAAPRSTRRRGARATRRLPTPAGRATDPPPPTLGFVNLQLQLLNINTWGKQSPQIAALAISDCFTSDTPVSPGDVAVAPVSYSVRGATASGSPAGCKVPPPRERGGCRPAATRAARRPQLNATILIGGVALVAWNSIVTNAAFVTAAAADLAVSPGQITNVMAAFSSRRRRDLLQVAGTAVSFQARACLLRSPLPRRRADRATPVPA